MGFILGNMLEAIKSNCKTRENKHDVNHIMLVEEAHRLLSKYESGDSMNKKQGVEMFADMLAEQPYILDFRPGCAESGRGLDEVCTGAGNTAAKLDLLLLGEVAGFHDHLEYLVAAGFFHRRYLLLDPGKITVLHHS